MASRSRASYDLADAPDLVSAEMTPVRRTLPRAQSLPAAHDWTADAQVRAAQQPLTAATPRELLPSRAPVRRNGLTILLLFLAVFLVAAGTSFLQAYLRDHRSATAATATPEIRIAPNPDGNLDIRTDSPADRGQVPAAVPETPAPEVSTPERASTAEPKPRANVPVISKPLRERSPSRAAVKPANKFTTRSATVTRPSKPVSSPTQVRRAPEQQIARGPNMPAVPLNSAAGTQPSVASQQALPKPPEPKNSAAQSPANTSAPSNASINAAPPGPQSPSKNVPQSAGPAQASPQPTGVPNSAYVPARPLKWAAPDARSLGVSRIAQAVDIAVKIRIDEAGHVTSAHALVDGSVHDPAVMAAATAVVKQWTFEPAKMQGKNVASEDTVVIHVDPKR